MALSGVDLEERGGHGVFYTTNGEGLLTQLHKHTQLRKR